MANLEFRSTSSPTILCHVNPNSSFIFSAIFWWSPSSFRFYFLSSTFCWSHRSRIQVYLCPLILIFSRACTWLQLEFKQHKRGAFNGRGSCFPSTHVSLIVFLVTMLRWSWPHQLVPLPRLILLSSTSGRSSWLSAQNIKPFSKSHLGAHVLCLSMATSFSPSKLERDPFVCTVAPCSYPLSTPFTR